jgi:hypothetical protein
MSEGFGGIIRSARRLAGGVRVELVGPKERCHIDLTAEEARKHAMGVIACCEPLTDTARAALAVEKIEGGDHG